jgi:hypothetical protein
MLRTASLFAFAVLLAGIAVAGGDSWPARVLSVSSPEEGRTTLVLEPLEESYEWKGCATVTIVSTLDRELIGLRTWSSSLDEAKYEQALAALREAAEKQSAIRFGSMGAGLKQTSEKCKLMSRGLELLTEPKGTVAIYSYHDPT